MMKKSDNSNEHMNERNIDWWHTEDGFTYTITPLLGNGFTSNSMISWSEDELNHATRLVANWFTNSARTNGLFSSTLSWSDRSSTNSLIRSDNCTPGALPIEIQFSGIGDYDPGFYMKAVLFIVAIIGILGMF